MFLLSLDTVKAPGASGHILTPSHYILRLLVKVASPFSPQYLESVTLFHSLLRMLQCNFTEVLETSGCVSFFRYTCILVITDSPRFTVLLYF